VTELSPQWQQKIEHHVGSRVVQTELIQSVWSGYGQLLRLHFEAPDCQSVVVKAVSPPDVQNHPRGWQSDIAHERKLKSYRVEACWYEQFAPSISPYAPMPHALLVQADENDQLLVLEDLNAQYPRQLNPQNRLSCRAGVEWLAQLHASQLGNVGNGLWETGCYWHLATRPEEWEVMEEGPLKTHAAAIDQALADCEASTLVHGDAKAANFCLSADGRAVAAVDFQYVGRGCGMRDLTYFLGSCLSDKDLFEQAGELLDHYFQHFRVSLRADVEETRIDRIEQRWRELYAFAWADFHRFLLGWSPSHVKLNQYSETQSDIALTTLSRIIG